jgi:uncharacterized caspase-like protein
MPSPAPVRATSGRRLALVTGTATYADPTLQQLRSPGHDTEQLASVLEDPAVGAFGVTKLVDAPKETIMRGVLALCETAGPNDLILIYLSCHGVLDSRNRLYYAATDTERDALSVTAMSAAWLNDQLEECRAKQQIMILDCCHSGAFAEGHKGGEALGLQERFQGRGRMVLTASRSTEYSFEGTVALGDPASSLFTRTLVDGILSGEADHDQDGLITVSELYGFAYDALRATTAQQTPSLWSYGAEGNLLVAHSPRGAVVEPAALPEDLVVALESPRRLVREGAVRAVADLLSSPDPASALAARIALERVAAEDTAQVAAVARQALGVSDPTAIAHSEGQTIPAAVAPVRMVPTEPPAPPARDDAAFRNEPPASAPARADLGIRHGVSLTGFPWGLSLAEFRWARFGLYMAATGVAVLVVALVVRHVDPQGTKHLHVSVATAAPVVVVVACWCAAMLTLGDARVGVGACVLITLGVGGAALLAGFGIKEPFILHAREQLPLESVAFGVFFGVAIGAVARSRQTLLVATISAVLVGAIGGRIVPHNLPVKDYGRAVEYGVLTTMLQVLVTAAYLALAPAALRPTDRSSPRESG